ncbi:hypothetical protein FKR81_09875 [Lentzea tibetensis]|uniref:DUF4352 domain-containing protein n=1 Tax=Lentzea tibetensis TaxID=2591470 RepID=A0A563EYA2_9PSEU|nr:hypothetical protein [Lentzea tibetensis]TWP52603.1 hypothetical protein FKR81_09875 [Lentzea tibetensis]
MKFAVKAAGLCLLLAVAGCAGPSVAVAPDENPAVLQRAEPRGGFADFGTQRVWASGLSITVGPPQSLKPSETAFPQAARTAVFTVTVFNGSKVTFRPSQLSVRALAGGQPTPELTDSVQGLNGLAAAVRELQPGQDTKLTLAFAVPENPVDLRLTVLPGGPGQDTATDFEGQA